MIRVLFLDLGETLVHGDEPLPHVVDVLPLLNQFVTAEAKPLAVGLVSDFKTPSPPPTPAKIEALFAEYVSLLEGFTLKDFFEPVNERITLSTQAGVPKPDQAIFKLALQRLGVDASFGECLFITENTTHLDATKILGMKTLQFGGSPPQGFADWSEGIMMIAALVEGKTDKNFEMALRLRLDKGHHLTLVSWKRSQPAGTITAKVRQWRTFSDTKLGALKGIQVEVPTVANIRVNPDGTLKSVAVEPLPSDAIAETQVFLQSLVDNKQVAFETDAVTASKTHQVVLDAQGRRTLKRRGYSFK